MLIVGSRVRLRKNINSRADKSFRKVLDRGLIGNIEQAHGEVFHVRFSISIVEEYSGWFNRIELEEIGVESGRNNRFKVGDTLRITHEWGAMGQYQKLAWENNYPLKVLVVTENPLGYRVEFKHGGHFVSMSIGSTVVEKIEPVTEFKIGDRVKLDRDKEYFIPENTERARLGVVGVVHSLGEGTILVTFPGKEYPYTMDYDTVIKVESAPEFNDDPAKKYLDGITEEIAEIEKLISADAAKISELREHLETIKDKRRVLRKLKETWENIK